ncbi:unnamed protein product [Parnassius apollo]|uniref:(apollo) hypothetical protein n=1 Tax=Parnassius apollo TaxID=110799 RepID=A0A8S3XNF1_PARAO|nr:unnamed protein product [Parnassius apollo]
MQPLISPIDHESRTNSYRAEDEPRTSRRRRSCSVFQEGQYKKNKDTRSPSENVLPPVEQLVLMVSRFQWDKINQIQTFAQKPSTKASQVIVVETGTRQCYGTSDCAKLLNAIQATNTSSIPYNFMI